MNNNQIILNGCIENFKRENEIQTNDSNTFELFCITQITKSTDLAFDEIENSIVDGGNDGGIDSIIVVVDDNLIPFSVSAGSLEEDPAWYCAGQELTSPSPQSSKTQAAAHYLQIIPA